MKVILLEDVKNLAKAGAVVSVADGYARNFLLPRRMVLEATPRNLEVAKREQARREKATAERMREMRGLADRITGGSYTIEMETGEDGKLFGSVTTHNLADLLKSHSADISHVDVVLDESVRQVGCYHARVKLGDGVDAPFKFWVVDKKK